MSLLKKRIADVFVDCRRLLLILVVLATAVLAAFIPSLEKDPSLRSGLVTGSDWYPQYERFLRIFGAEEFILIAIKNQMGVGDPRFLSSLASITGDLAKVPEIDQVVSLTNLRFFREKNKRFGRYPIVINDGGLLWLPDKANLYTMRKAMPVLDFLVAPDLKTAGVLVKVVEPVRFDPNATKKILAHIDDVVKHSVPPGSDYRITGAATIRQAILRKSDLTAVIFGSLCALLCAGVTIYVFRSAKVTAVTLVILGTCVVWVLGLMSLLGIPLTATTSVSFGLILLTALEIVIHMVVRFNQFRELANDRLGAVKETVRYLARPCLFCASTTAVGFGALMVTTIPMVFQLGATMSLGIMICYFLAMTMTPAFILSTRSLDTSISDKKSGDLFARAVEKAKEAISNHHKLFAIFGVIVAVLMFSGAPLIRTDPQWLRLLGDSSPEVEAIHFVEANLTEVHTLELMLETEDQGFKKPNTWKKVAELEKRLRQIPEVVSTDSFLSVLEYLQGILSAQGSSPEDLFENPGSIPQFFLLVKSSSDGRRHLRGYLNENFDTLHITVRVKNEPSTPLIQTIGQVQAVASSVMKGVARPTLTGDLVVIAMQAQDFIKSQIHSMIIATVIITILMMIQMGTPLFGLISLIPNVPPVAAVFGIMGWFGIGLNGMTVFAATVAVGLAVDNTIHFVAQLKREIKLNPELGVEECMFRAYGLAAKPMAAWSVVTCLGFLTLLVTPYWGAQAFGILVSSAVLMGVFGDLILVQSMILTFPALRKLIRRVIEKEMAAQT